jgi:hypothetical protein
MVSSLAVSGIPGLQDLVINPGRSHVVLGRLMSSVGLGCLAEPAQKPRGHARRGND